MATKTITLEKALVDPESAYLYACRVVRDRWPQGESVIAQDIEYSYYYARFLESQWFVNEFGYVGAPAVIETTVAQSPLYAYLYATEVIRARWPQGEPAIARGPYAYWYAREIIKHRWPAAEPTIVCSDKAVDYLHYFQKEFTKAEEIVWLLKQ